MPSIVWVGACLRMGSCTQGCQHERFGVVDTITIWWLKAVGSGDWSPVTGAGGVLA